MAHSKLDPADGIGAFLRALLRHWAAFITGGAFAALVFLVTNVAGVTIPKWQYFAAFVWAGAIVAGFKAWAELHEIALGLSADLANERSARERDVTSLRAELEGCRRELHAKPVGPKLSLRFDPKDPRCVSNEGGDEMFRVKAVNEGDTRATGVHVFLDAVQPPRPTLLNERFKVMKSGDSDTFDVGPRASVYVDVLSQRQHASYGYVQVLRLKGAQWIEQAKEVTLVLRLEAEVPADPLTLHFVADERRSLRPVLPQN